MFECIPEDVVYLNGNSEKKKSILPSNYRRVCFQRNFQKLDHRDINDWKNLQLSAIWQLAEILIFDVYNLPSQLGRKTSVSYLFKNMSNIGKFK